MERIALGEQFSTLPRAPKEEPKQETVVPSGEALIDASGVGVVIAGNLQVNGSHNMFRDIVVTGCGASSTVKLDIPTDWYVEISNGLFSKDGFGFMLNAQRV
jgi:hypothetical protein